MRRALLPFALATLVASAPLSAAQAVPVAAEHDRAQVVDEVLRLGREDNRAQDHLRYVTQGIGQRLTSSSNLTRACEWAVHQFQSMGLEARMEPWGEFPVGFDRGPATGAMVAPERLEYLFGTPAWTPGTPGPVRGRAVLEPKSEEELEAVRDQLPGAWLVRHGSRASRSVREVVDAAVDAAGIAGEVRKGGDRIVVFGNHRITWEELPTGVSIRLLTEHYDDLLGRLQEGQEVELEFDVDNRFVRGPITLFNVVADIPGTEFPDEYVVVGGHIDSWHLAEGTNDNGTGVATTLEAARLLMAAGARPRRTVRFMLWSGEEQGLLGSRGWVQDNLDLMPRISGVLVHDKGTNYLSGITCPPALAKDLREVFAPVADYSPDMPFRVTENQGLSRAGGSSDHASFLAEGVPGLFWNQSGESNYGTYWHTHLDTFDSAVPTYQEHSSVVAAIGALGIANLDHMLDRTGLFAERGQSDRRPYRRLMGVRLEGATVTRVFESRKADEAGWQVDDVVLTVDGVEVASTDEVVSELQKGGPKKTIVLQRGDEKVTTVLDYTEYEKDRETDDDG